MCRNGKFVLISCYTGSKSNEQQVQSIANGLNRPLLAPSGEVSIGMTSARRNNFTNNIVRSSSERRLMHFPLITSEVEIHDLMVKNGYYREFNRNQQPRRIESDDQIGKKCYYEIRSFLSS